MKNYTQSVLKNSVIDGSNKRMYTWIGIGTELIFILYELIANEFILC